MNRYPIILLLLLLLPIVVAETIAQPPVPSVPAKNMTLLGHVEPVTNEEAGGLHNSCWGYAAPDGREYGFFGTFHGTYVIDLDSDPIRTIDFIPGAPSTWRNIKTRGSWAYISTENRKFEEGAGLQIVDLSTLPDSVSLVATDTSHMYSAHTLWIEGDYLYAWGTRAEAGVNGGGLILDISDPTNPVRAGGVAERYYHDGVVRNDTLVGAAINDGGVDIVDVSDKENPRVIGRISYPFAGTHNTALSEDGRYVLTSDEIGFTPKTMKVWDITDPDDILLVAEYSPNLVETIHNVRVRGRYAFAAWYTAGVRVIDIVDPLHPREVAFADTYPGRDGGFNGVWEVYPWLPSGRVIASDRNSGLYLFGFDNVTAGSISGTVRDGETDGPIPSPTITITDRSEPIEGGVDGSYYVGAVDGEQIEVTFSAYGYHDSTLTATIDGDATFDIPLRPRPMTELEISVVDRATEEGLDRFVFAIPGTITSTDVDGDRTTVTLPQGVDFTVVVGRWGHRPERRTIRLSEANESLRILLDRGYVDDATLDLGWQAYDGEGAALTGRWDRIEPYLGYPRSDWVHPPREPSGAKGWIFFTGSPPRFAPPERDDVSFGRSTLVSPTMNLRDIHRPIIVLDRWYVHFERDTVLDAFTLELSSDDGATWTEVYREVKGKAGWEPISVVPSEHVILTDSMRMRVTASDTLGNILVVAGMDNFEVLGRATSSVAMSSTPTSSAVRIDFLTDRRVRLSGPHTPITATLYTIDGRRIADLYSGDLPGTLVLPIPTDRTVPVIVVVKGEGGEVVGRVGG